MPCFGIFEKNPFQTTKLKPRDAESLLTVTRNGQINREFDDLEIRKIQLQLGDFVSEFQDGGWVHRLEGSDGNFGEILKLRKLTDKFKKEVNMLRIKNDILLDKVAAKELEIEAKDKELAQMKRFINKSSVNSPRK